MTNPEEFWTVDVNYSTWGLMSIPITRNQMRHYSNCISAPVGRFWKRQTGRAYAIIGADHLKKGQISADLSVRPYTFAPIFTSYSWIGYETNADIKLFEKCIANTVHPVLAVCSEVLLCKRAKGEHKTFRNIITDMYIFLWVKQKCRPEPNAAPKWKRHLILHVKNILKQPEIAAFRAGPDRETSKPVHAGLSSFCSRPPSGTIIDLHPDKISVTKL